MHLWTNIGTSEDVKLFCAATVSVLGLPRRLVVVCSTACSTEFNSVHFLGHESEATCSGWCIFAVSIAVTLSVDAKRQET